MLSCGIYVRWPLTDALRLYTPLNALAHKERFIFEQQWPLNEGHYVPGRQLINRRQCQVIVTARDGGNVLRSEIGKIVRELNHFIIHDIQRFLDLLH
ncbi:hypothetical protein D918_01705 [Trichuris suis]|nr:hypothetical protein D918_01705 [Trichuris suis]